MVVPRSFRVDLNTVLLMEDEVALVVLLGAGQVPIL